MVANSWGEAARRAWRSRSGRIAGSLMSKIVRLWPASSSFAAIGWPMLPTPRYPASITLPPSRRLRRQFTSQTQEFRVEHLCRHYLAAADQPDLVRAVIGERPVQRAEMVPDQQVILGPHISPAKLRLELVREQVFKRLVALALRQFVDPLGEAGVAVEHLLPVIGWVRKTG